MYRKIIGLAACAFLAGMTLAVYAYETGEVKPDYLAGVGVEGPDE